MSSWLPRMDRALELSHHVCPTKQLDTPTILSYSILALSEPFPSPITICLVQAQKVNLLCILCEFQDWDPLTATDSQLKLKLQTFTSPLHLSSIYPHFWPIIQLPLLFLAFKFHFSSHSFSFSKPIINQTSIFVP